MNILAHGKQHMFSCFLGYVLSFRLRYACIHICVCVYKAQTKGNSLFYYNNTIKHLYKILKNIMTLKRKGGNNK